MNRKIELDESLHSFKFSQRYGWKLLGYFNHESDIRKFVTQNNLQIGDRIRRKIENDQLACQALPDLSVLSLGHSIDLKSIRERIICGKRLLKRFNRQLQQYLRAAERRQLNSEIDISRARMDHKDAYGESAMV